ncbi:DUF6884 domain-containing protein [Intrasporangium mesophilum]
MANWNLLTAWLGQTGDTVTLTWSELDEIVGGLPPSASKHRAWWSGDRTHVHAWRSVGFRVTNLVMGRDVTFARDPDANVSIAAVSSTAPSSVVPESATPTTDERPHADVLLVTCVKSKLKVPAAAKNLYVSALFHKERSYAERLGRPWFILSAEHGLVAPDEWLAPYERYLPDTPRTYRTAWGAWAAERLELLVGSLAGKVIEVHASAPYVDAVRAPLEAKGAVIRAPLDGLTQGQRLHWYDEQDLTRQSPVGLTASRQSYEDAARFAALLMDESSAASPDEFIAGGSADMKQPGLYSWWVDATGAAHLTKGLDLLIHPGLIYAGLAGATRWPSGRRSQNTLWSRITGMHLGGRHEFSTFRRTLGSILAHAHGSPTIDETALSQWMEAHLKVVAIPYKDADTLGRLEREVLEAIDPPLNLQGMDSSSVRRRITELRRPHSVGRRNVVTGSAVLTRRPSRGRAI